MTDTQISGQAIETYLTDTQLIRNGITNIVEIVAVLTGLLIALSNPYLAYNELTEPELIDKVLAFQGVLPLFAIAVVEATKIPLAQGFYMSRMLRWKILFMTALLLLMTTTYYAKWKIF